MDSTDNLALPYLMPSQAQKHVTHNEALGMLDALVHLSVLDRHLATPPASPEPGDRYIVASGASGAWAGHEGAIAHWVDGGWSFYPPRAGFLCHVADEGAVLCFDGSDWTDLGGVLSALQNLARLGIGTTADAGNPFAAKLNKALWTARTTGEGGDDDLRYTLNKQAAGNVLSLLLQSGFSGRAELGLIGDDDLSLKVSPDGSSWTTALVVDRSDGGVFARPACGGQATIATDANLTLQVRADPEEIRHTGTLTAHRTVSLSNTNAHAGARFRISRHGGGAFNLNVGSGPLRALATGQWAEFVHDGSAWYVAAGGSL